MVPLLCIKIFQEQFAAKRAAITKEEAMSDEILVTIDISVDNAEFETRRNVRNKSFDQSTANFETGIATTSTSEGDITFVSTSVGMTYIKNLSSTTGEIIKIGGATGELWLHVKPGESTLFRFAADTAKLYHQSVAGAPKFEYLVLAD